MREENTREVDSPQELEMRYKTEEQRSAWEFDDSGASYLQVLFTERELNLACFLQRLPPTSAPTRHTHGHHTNLELGAVLRLLDLHRARVGTLRLDEELADLLHFFRLRNVTQTCSSLHPLLGAVHIFRHA